MDSWVRTRPAHRRCAMLTPPFRWLLLARIGTPEPVDGRAVCVSGGNNGKSGLHPPRLRQVDRPPRTLAALAAPNTTELMGPRLPVGRTGNTSAERADWQHRLGEGGIILNRHGPHCVANSPRIAAEEPRDLGHPDARCPALRALEQALQPSCRSGRWKHHPRQRRAGLRHSGRFRGCRWCFLASLSMSADPGFTEVAVYTEDGRSSLLATLHGWLQKEDGWWGHVMVYGPRTLRAVEVSTGT